MSDDNTFLSAETVLKVSVKSTIDDPKLTSFIQEGKYILISLKEDLELNIETGKLHRCSCYIPALDTTAQSINHAATLISEAFETHRKSHTKDVFRDVFFQKNNLWKPLQKWREEVDLIFGINIKKVTNSLNKNFNQPNNFNKILDLINVSKEIAEFIIELGLDDENNKNEDDKGIKIQKKLNTLIGVEKLKQILKIWKENHHNSSEAFWQELLSKNSFILSQIFSVPAIILGSQTYVGGKGIDNIGGSILDFLLINKLTRNTALIEIKTPVTNLLTNTEYRNGVYNPSHDLSGAVNQVSSCRHSLTKNYQQLIYNSDKHFEVFNPVCMVIIGHTNQLDNEDLRSSFELHRANYRDIQILTYDEMFEKIKILIDLLEGPD
ncbi:MAG TPA: Shedu immune nuclease family protein [Oculatellaceae cyanobacterium]|jgi:hypothetical protein